MVVNVKTQTSLSMRSCLPEQSQPCMCPSTEYSTLHTSASHVFVKMISRCPDEIRSLELGAGRSKGSVGSTYGDMLPQLDVYPTLH